MLVDKVVEAEGGEILRSYIEVNYILVNREYYPCNYVL